MLQANLFKFSKRRNSTARPTGDGAVVNVVLKAPTSFHNPSFQIAGTAMDYNYMYFDGRYFWITDVVSERNNLWTIHTEMDVLATYKDNILATSAYVEYDNSPNGIIPDQRIPVYTNGTIVKNTAPMPDFDPQNGQAVITVVGQNGCRSYSMFLDDAETLLNNIDSWFQGDAPEFDSENALESAFNLVKYGTLQTLTGGDAAASIKSAIWIPYQIGEGLMQDVMLGLFNTGKQGLPVTNRRASWDLRVTIPWQFQDWRNTSPYTEVMCYIPFVGIVRVPSGLLSATDQQMGLYCSLDIVTGDMSLRLYAQRGTQEINIGVYQANISTPILIGSVNWDLGKVVSGAVSGVASALSGNLGGVAGAALDAIDPQMQTAGGLGGTSAYSTRFLDFEVWCVIHNTLYEPANLSAVCGTPTGEIKQLGTISGYVQTRNASVSTDGFGGVNAEINGLLDGGVYIE